MLDQLEQFNATDITTLDSISRDHISRRLSRSTGPPSDLSLGEAPASAATATALHLPVDPLFSVSDIEAQG